MLQTFLSFFQINSVVPLGAPTRAPTRGAGRGGQWSGAALFRGAALLVNRRNSKWSFIISVVVVVRGPHFSTLPWAALPHVGALVPAPKFWRTNFLTHEIYVWCFSMPISMSIRGGYSATDNFWYLRRRRSSCLPCCSYQKGYLNPKIFASTTPLLVITDYKTKHRRLFAPWCKRKIYMKVMRQAY